MQQMVKGVRRGGEGGVGRDRRFTTTEQSGCTFPHCIVTRKNQSTEPYESLSWIPSAMS